VGFGRGSTHGAALHPKDRYSSPDEALGGERRCEACGLEYTFALAIKTPLQTQEWLVTIGPPGNFIKLSCPKCGQGEVPPYVEGVE
jgi:uncharacterized protein (DUF983 family)